MSKSSSSVVSPREELSATCQSTKVIISVHNSMGRQRELLKLEMLLLHSLNNIPTLQLRFDEGSQLFGLFNQASKQNHTQSRVVDGKVLEVS